MLLTLSIPTSYPEVIVRQAAPPHTHARIKWARPSQLPHLPAECRFKLVESTNDSSAANSWKPASAQAHDTLIAALFQQDPNATVRTARAVYEGQKDFVAQMAARVD